MKILMVSSEAVPFCKSGGLADVVGALSAEFVQQGLDCRVLLPLYGTIDRTGMEPTGLETTIVCDGKPRKVSFLRKVWRGVPYYFIDHPWYTGRKGIYGDTSFTPYADNLARYALMDQAALAFCKSAAWAPDIIHCHDWTTGFIPYLLATRPDPFFAGTSTVTTIHNLAYQGDFSRLDFLKSDLPASPDVLEGSGSGARCNMLKTGLYFSDEITTVSPTYAKEIQGPAYGCGLDWLMVRRKDHLHGIINGIDTDEWNPETDPVIPRHFSARDFSGKAALKAMVQEKFGLAQDPKVPLIAMISRLAEQKGFKELLEGEPCALERIVRDCGCQVVVVGTGDHAYEARLTALGKRYPNLSVNILFSNQAAHLLEAGADYFLMPSRFEPCGLNQLYSLRYGTLPIARRTGGLADSILDIDQDPEHGTGFLFDQMTGSDIEQAVRRALSYWPDLEKWRKNAMAGDYSWRKSALYYRDLYRKQQQRKEVVRNGK